MINNIIALIIYIAVITFLAVRVFHYKRRVNEGVFGNGVYNTDKTDDITDQNHYSNNSFYELVSRTR